MLELAYLHKDELNKKLAQSALDPKNFYFSVNGYSVLEVGLKDDTWSEIQMVSICENEIYGYLSASVSQAPRYIQQLNVINFSNEPFVYARDLIKFINLLLNEFRFNKICFSVAVGNPAEGLYDKAIGRLGGKIVGTFKDHYQTPDGKIHDAKWYEILRI